MKLTTLALGALSASSLTIAAPATGAHKANLEARLANMLEARQDPVSGIIEMATGIFIAIVGESIGGDLHMDIGNAMATAFNPSGPKAPYDNMENCIIELHTQGGVSLSSLSWPPDTSPIS